MPGRWRCGCGSVPRARRPTADRVRRGGARRPPPGRAGRFRYAAPRRPWGSRRRTHRRRIRNPPARRCARRTRRPRWPARPGHGRGFAPRSRRWRSGSPGRRASAYRKGWCRTVARRRATGRRGASSGGAAASGSPRATAPGIRRRSVPARCGCVAAGYWRSARPLAWPRGRRGSTPVRRGPRRRSGGSAPGTAPRRRRGTGRAIRHDRGSHRAVCVPASACGARCGAARPGACG